MNQTLLQLDDVHKSYGTNAVLDGASLSISEREKIGVIGRNGAGKTTLFRLAVGIEGPDRGRVIRQSILRLGYLEQHAPYRLEETAMAFLLRRSGKPQWECAKAASRFRLTHEHLAHPIGGLSEGFRMRARLSDVILREPNLLLLDEPTNYLDLETQILLERFLAEWRGALLLISHDREFIKNTCDRTLEVERGRVFLYPGPIEEYLAWKAEEMERIRRENEKVDAKKRHLQAFVDHFRYKASKAAQAQERLRQIAKLEKIEIEHPMAGVRIRIPHDKIKKGIALTTEDLSIGYAGHVVASGIDLELYRGRHVAILGDNGAGKTTLLRTLSGLQPALAGTYRWGADLRIAYYGQSTQDGLDPRGTVEAHLKQAAAAGVTLEDIYAMAGNFLFGEDDRDKTVSVLSGGERARLALACLLLSKKPLFLLDEPTNHLDFETVEALGRALREYPGTIFFVSHNRTFVHLIATAIVEIRDGKVRTFTGSYDDYVYHLRQTLGEGEGQGGRGAGGEEALEEEEKPAAEREVREEIEAQKRKLKRIEKKLADLETEREDILTEMNMNPTVYSPRLGEKLKKAMGGIEGLEKDWYETRQAIQWLERE